MLTLTVAAQLATLTACAGNTAPDELDGSGTTTTRSTGGGSSQAFTYDPNFKSTLVGQGWDNADTAMRFIADFDGDGLSDLVAMDPDQLYFSKNISAMFAKPQTLRDDFSQAIGWTSEDTTPRLMGDVNGDGKADLIGCGYSNLVVNTSDGSSTTGQASYNQVTAFTISDGYASQDVAPRFVADVNGDGKADMVGINNLGVRVALSNGVTFAAPTVWSAEFKPTSSWTSQSTTLRVLADVNGDGKADIVGFGSDAIFVALSTGTSFAPSVAVSTEFVGDGWSSNNSTPRFVADTNGDGYADFIGIDNDGVHIALGAGKSVAQASYIAYVGFQPKAGWSDQVQTPRFVVDINGDHKADILGFQSTGLMAVLAP